MPGAADNEALDVPMGVFLRELPGIPLVREQDVGGDGRSRMNETFNGVAPRNIVSVKSVTQASDFKRTSFRTSASPFRRKGDQ